MLDLTPRSQCSLMNVLDGVHVSYDKMESYLLPYGSSEALAVARDLDTKVTTLLHECAS